MSCCASRRRVGINAPLLILALGSLSPLAFAQQQKLDREIAFVRSLAREMRFIELAKEEADRLASEFRGAADQDKIAQLGVEVSYYGARSRSDRAQQRALFKEAIDKSKELVERSSDPAVQMGARGTLANASQEFGQFLIEELEIARETAPERVKELEDEAAEVFKVGIDACTKVMEILKPQMSDDQKRTEYLVLWMRRGVLSRERARAVKADRAVLIQASIDDLSEMVLEAGEETALGLRGLFEIAQCREVAGDIPSAIDSYKGTTLSIGNSLQQADELGLSGEMAAFLFEMMQEVYVRTGEVMIKEGAPGTAELFAQFRKDMEAYGEKGKDIFDVVSDEHGHLMLLAESRFLAESGDPKKVASALAMTQRINDQHPADFVGVKAKAALRDILAAQSSLVSGKLLFEIGKGEFQNKNYEEAVKGLRRAIGAMTPEEQKAIGLEAYQMLGQAFGASGRGLESVLALSQGLEQFAKDDKEKATDVADVLDRAITALKRQTKNDTFFDPTIAAASRLVGDYGGSSVGSKLFWKSATDQFAEKKFVEAIAEYKKITPDFLFYEQAQVRIAKAYCNLGDFDTARKTLADYAAWAAANALDPKDTGKAQVREVSAAEAEYTQVTMAYFDARGNEELKRAKDLTKYPVAIERARGFVTNFAKGGESNLPVVLEYLGRMHCDLGQLDRAEEAYAQLKEKDPTRASRLATEIFREYQNQVKSLVAEVDKAIKEDKGDAAINTATTTVNAMRTKLVALGSDYVAASPKPQLAVLIGTMLEYEQLGEWKRVDEIAQRTLTLYGDDKAKGVKDAVDLLVRPKIGEALLQQQRFQDAYTMLIEAEKANPTQWEIKRQICRALGGWFEFSKTGAPTKVPGLDRPAEAYQKYYGEYRTWGERKEVAKYSLEWYRFQWESYWFAKQAAAKDSKFKDIADKFYRIARATDDFATLKNHGTEGLNLFKYFQINR